MKDYQKTLEYTHWGPVRRDLVKGREDWKWSSAYGYAGMSPEEQKRRCDCGLIVCACQPPRTRRSKTEELGVFTERRLEL